MSFKTQRGLRNALLQRVRRHALIATIFRAADPIPSSETRTLGMDSVNNSGAQKGANLVQATLLSLSLEPSYTTKIDTNSVVVRRPPSSEPSVQKTSVPFAQFESPQTVKKDVGPEGTFSPDDTVTDDPVWQQLKTINRLHQEKNVYEGSTDRINKPLPNPVQREPQGQNFPDSVDKAGNPQNPELTLDSMSIRDRLDRDLNSSGKQDIANQSGSDLGNQVLDELNDQHILPLSNRFKKDPKVSYHQYGLDPQTNQQQRNPSDSGKQIEDKEDVRIDTDLSLDDYMEDSSSKQDDPNPSLHNVPLEEVWPVQKQENHSEAKKPPIEGVENPAITTHSGSPAPQPEFNNLVGFDTIQKALRNVIPNQPTSSSIEIIPPRRPRPQSPTIVKRQRIERPSKGSDTGTQTTSHQSTVSQANLNRKISSNQEMQAGSVQLPKTESKPVKSQHDPTSKQRLNNHETSKDHKYIEFPNQPSPNGDATLQQGFPKEIVNDSENKNEPDSDMIQTEIGPLPVDLWEILDRHPPSSLGQEGVIPESPPTHAEPKTTIQRAEASPVDKNITTRLHTSDKQIKLEETSIQRTASTDNDLSATPDSSSSETIQESATESENSQPSETDIDELSRRVYAEIHRYLSVEWERSRKRS